MGKFFAGCLGAMVLLFCLTVGGKVEGSLFPVTSFTSFEIVENVSEVASRVSGTSLKKRGKCTFSHMDFATARGTKAPVTFEEGTKDREDGWFDFGPWLVLMTPEQLSEATIYVYHRCHPFWLTQTLWYKGEGNL